MRPPAPALSVFLLALPLGAADSWPQFRGPQSTGVADDPALPETWSATRNVVWKTEIPGSGWSSPGGWGDRIFLTSVLRTVAPEAPQERLLFGRNPQSIPAHH